MTEQECRSFPGDSQDQVLRELLRATFPNDAKDGGRFACSPAAATSIDPETAGDDLVKLVLVLVETVRQLIERQAIRRVDTGSLSEAEVERLGLALLKLEERMTELKEHFGLSDEDLALRLGSFQELVEEACLE